MTTFGGVLDSSAPNARYGCPLASTGGYRTRSQRVSEKNGE